MEVLFNNFVVILRQDQGHLHEELEFNAACNTVKNEKIWYTDFGAQAQDVLWGHA